MQRPAETSDLPYPGPGHILRYVRLAMDASDPDRTEAVMPALPDLCDPAGAVRLGPIALLADYAAGVTSHRAVRPDWPVTHDLALHLMRPAPAEGELEAVCTITRAGRNSVVSETAVTSPVIGDVARVIITFSRLPRRDDTPTEAVRSPVVNLADDPSIERPRLPLDEAVGFRFTAGERPAVAFDHDPFIHNSLGAIQGGVIALALERAASWAAEPVFGARVRTTDLHLHYLALGRRGPFEARAETLRVGPGSVVSRVALVDTGDDDRLLALGVGTAEPVAVGP